MAVCPRLSRADAQLDQLAHGGDDARLAARQAVRREPHLQTQPVPGVFLRIGIFPEFDASFFGADLKPGRSFLHYPDFSQYATSH